MSDSRPRWLRLAHALDHDGDRLLEDVARFEPLPFPAGHAAIEWLREATRGNHPVPAHAWLAMDASDSGVCGFFALREMEFTVTKTRLVLLQVRKHKLAPGPQPGMQLDWIARDARTPHGYGRTLVTFALAEAQAAEAKALIVEPDNDRTRHVFERHHHFVPFEQRPGESFEHPEWLWFPIGRPPQGGPT